jgi:Ca-activated chloride channel homolog
MEFQNPIFLVLVFPTCLGLLWLYLRLRKSRQHLLHQFAASHLLERLTASVSTRRRNVKFVLLVVACASLFLALAQPQAGFRWEEAHRQGIDILMAVDTSKSMLTEDVQPNRLERAKLGILDFVSRLEGDRVGLIPFAGSAFLMCPLTLDYDAFAQSLKALDTTVMPRGGTDLASAIHEAEAAFASDANHRILVLITDGEDLEGKALSTAKAAAQRGITIHTVGVGTPAGEFIPAGRMGGFVKDEQGAVVKSRLDEEMLRQIAETTGGLYQPLGPQAEGLESIYREKLSLVPRQEIAQRLRKVPLERFSWPLGLALLLLALEYGLSDRKSARQVTQPVVTTAGRRPRATSRLARTAPATLLLFASLAWCAHASPRDAELAYERGDYATAAAQYHEALGQAPGDAKLQFNTGAAAYKTGDFAGAAGAFEAVVGAEDLELQKRAYYNLGNAFYRLGQQTEQSQPQRTMEQWQQALTAYQGTLALDPQDADAQYNHDLVKRRLEELEQQQLEQEQQPNQENQQDPQDQEAQTDPSQEGGSGSNQGDPDHQNNSEDSQDAGSGEAAGPDDPDQQEDQGSQDAASKDQAEHDAEQGSQPNPTAPDADQEQQTNPDIGPDGEPRQPQPSEGQQTLETPSGQPEPSQAADTPSPSGIGERRMPGRMTPEEAKTLLDSLRHEDGQTPIVPRTNGRPGRQQHDVRRDW